MFSMVRREWTVAPVEAGGVGGAETACVIGGRGGRVERKKAQRRRGWDLFVNKERMGERGREEMQTARKGGVRSENAMCSISVNQGSSVWSNSPAGLLPNQVNVPAEELHSFPRSF